MARVSQNSNPSDLVQEILDLKNEVDEFNRKRDEAQGALRQVMKQIKDEFGVATLDKAKQKLASLQTQCKRDTTKAEQLLKQYRDKWDEDDE